MGTESGIQRGRFRGHKGGENKQSEKKTGLQVCIFAFTIIIVCASLSVWIILVLSVVRL
jgi:hypothetical protein